MFEVLRDSEEETVTSSGCIIDCSVSGFPGRYSGLNTQTSKSHPLLFCSDCYYQTCSLVFNSWSASFQVHVLSFEYIQRLHTHMTMILEAEIHHMT